MHAGDRRHGAGGAEQVRLAVARAGRAARARPRTAASMSRDVRDHGLEHVAVHELAAEPLGQRDDAHRQRRPGGDAALHLQALRQRAAPGVLAARRGRARSAPTSRRRYRTPARSRSRNRSARRSPRRPAWPPPRGSTILMSRPVSLRARSRNSSRVGGEPAGLGGDQAGARPRGAARSWPRRPCSASSVRSMAGSDSRPLAETPSPSRMMREKASITLKPRRDGPGDQQPAVVGAEIEGGVCRPGRCAPLRRSVGRRSATVAVGLDGWRRRDGTRAGFRPLRSAAFPAIAFGGAQPGCAVLFLATLHGRSPAPGLSLAGPWASFWLNLPSTLSARGPG